MMFADKTDLVSFIRLYRLDQITEGDDTIVDEALSTAEDDIRNALIGPGYDHNAILNATGSDRNKTVLKWAKYLALYYLYERIPDEMVPDRVVKNYDDTNKDLLAVSSGRMSMDLPKLMDPVTNQPKTKFRGGSVVPKRH